MLFLLAIAVAASPQADNPADTQNNDTIIIGLAAQPDACNFSIAKKVKLEGLVRKPGEWAGKCVAVTGYWQGRALFEDRADARKKYAQSSDELDGQRIGIYAQDEVLEAAPKRAKPFTAVGIAGTCEQLWDGAIMVMGYCHYTGGPFIAVAEMRPR